MNRNKQNKISKRGFSLIEMLIAGFILSVGLIGFLRLVAESMKNSMDSRDHVIASGLAQEGLELVRNIRDNSIDPNVGSFENLPGGTTIDDCRIDKNSADVTECGAEATFTKKLYINSNFYDHNSAGTATKFQRKIRLEYQDSAGGVVSKDGGTPPPGNRDDDAYQVNVQSMVIWRAGAFPTNTGADLCNLQSKCVMLESTLTDRH